MSDDEDDGPAKCDLCGEQIVPNVDACYCAIGKPGEPHMGPALGDARHWRCHVEHFGRPSTYQPGDMERAFAGLREAMGRVGEALGKVREHIGSTEAQAAPPPPRRARGPCRMCGAYDFLHPTEACPEWVPGPVGWD